MSQSENVLSEESSINPLFSSEQDPQSDQQHPEESFFINPSLQNEHKERQRNKRGGKESGGARFEAFKQSFENQPDLEARLQLAIDFMEASLALEGTPHFQSFWEIRNLCLPLFKENLPSLFRHQMWTKYSELSREARRLKEALDDQSAFAVEQIEIAIDALEKEIADSHDQIEKIFFPSQEEFPSSLKEYTIYHNLQKQLSVLNLQASRINALRKELLKTEMRIRHKNKFFQRLSAAGDIVFPKRKELIRQISQQFTDDVDAFIQKHFSHSSSSHSALFVFREEIKALQGFAKVLTLNTHSFTYTRSRLSECWDQIKVEERERKKERVQQRVIFKENLETLQTQFQGLSNELEKEEISLSDGQKKLEMILAQMRKIELGREELKILREATNRIRDVIQGKLKDEESARQEREKEKQRQKQEKYSLLQRQIEELIQQAETGEEEKILEQRDLLMAQIQEASLAKNEKQELERFVKPLRDILVEKREKALLSLSEDDRQALKQLKEVLLQRKERRQEVKTQLEILRKASGAFSLDFEKAMSYTTQINEEKERLEKVDHAIREVENKIRELQSKLRPTHSNSK